jgi:hypothetical protein
MRRRGACENRPARDDSLRETYDWKPVRHATARRFNAGKTHYRRTVSRPRVTGEPFESCRRMSCQHRARTVLAARSRGEPHTPTRLGTNPRLHVRQRGGVIQRSRRRAARFARGQPDVREHRRSHASQPVLAVVDCRCCSTCLLGANTPDCVIDTCTSQRSEGGLLYAVPDCTAPDSRGSAVLSTQEGGWPPAGRLARAFVWPSRSTSRDRRAPERRSPPKRSPARSNTKRPSSPAW